MSILATELARMAGPKCKEAVSAALKRWEDKIRERIRAEMALKLTDESEAGRQVQRVAVKLCDGYPLSLVPYEEKLARDLAEIAGMYRPELESVQRVADALDELLKKLNDRSREWAMRAETELPRIEALRNLATDLLELSKRATFIDTLKEIDRDILGAYFPLGHSPKGHGPPVIEVYWSVIGAVAKLIGVDVEGLTVTILTHELAHAYSHLGADTDGNRWADRAFCSSEILTIEGIAQYYTEKILKWLQHRNNEGPYRAYSELLKIQGLPYHVHEKWAGEYSPEVVRAAIIECRNNKATKTDEFVAFMRYAKTRLAGPSAQDDLFGSG